MLPDDLRNPEAWPAPRPERVELIETHVSWVFRSERDVYKVKKPVDLGFLDFRSLDRRKRACQDEVELNARLAKGVYLGVVPIVAGADGTKAIGGPGEVSEWAVHMVRLDDAKRADAMLRAGGLQGKHLRALAHVMARFHDRAGVTPEEAVQWASSGAVSRNVRENFEQTRASVERYVSRRIADESEERQVRFLEQRAPLFERRIASGRIRDGHGDLRLEHVYLEEDGIRVIDCIEFDPRYRIADVCADVSFLAMDLEAAGRPDLAETFLASYARESDDFDLYALADFYAAYRSWVRGKVRAMLAEDAGAGSDLRSRAAHEARRHFLLAAASSRPSIVAPALVCVGGLIGSGKSTLAETVAEELCCPVVDADRTRKHMMGVSETHPLPEAPWQGAYDPSVTDRVYSELLRRASVVLASGRPVVIDASFRSRATRQAARELAQSKGVVFRFVECVAPVEVCRARSERRSRQATQSDGRPAIFDDFARSFEPVTELAPPEHFTVNTTEPSERCASQIRSHMVTWPTGLLA